jgi:hypothetical protein
VIVAAILLVGAGVAFDDQRWYVTVAYLATTLASALSAGWSFMNMLSAGDVARRRLDARLPRPSLKASGDG